MDAKQFVAGPIPITYKLPLLGQNKQKAMAGMGLIAAFNSQPSLLQPAIESLTVVNSSC